MNITSQVLYVCLIYLLPEGMGLEEGIDKVITSDILYGEWELHGRNLYCKAVVKNDTKLHHFSRIQWTYRDSEVRPNDEYTTVQTF